MKFFYFIIIFIFLNNCSFDNKTGIWKNENLKDDKLNNTFKDFQNLSPDKNRFSEQIPITQNFEFLITESKEIYSWQDIFFNLENNSENFNYSNLNNLIYKGKKVSRKTISDRILFENNNVIISDIRGNLIINSISEKKIKKFNFYKKKYKNLDIKINFSIENDVIYVADNLGYLYAYNHDLDKILWAKNYKIPFRSNIKIIDELLIAANQNNNLYLFDKKNGDIIRSIPTEETILKNEFTNNISANIENIFFLNTFGSLYSINKNSRKLNWFINLNQTLDFTPSNLFRSSPIISNNNKLIISSNTNTFVIDSNSGTIIYKYDFGSNIKPLIINDYLFLVTIKDFLISLDLNSGKIIYSYELNKKTSDFLKSKKKKIYPKNIAMLSDNIFLFLENSFALKFDIYGNLNKIIKFSNKFETYPIFIDKNIIYVNKKNKVVIIN